MLMDIANKELFMKDIPGYDMFVKIESIDKGWSGDTVDYEPTWYLKNIVGWRNDYIQESNHR